jgi:hypothetical protein
LSEPGWGSRGLWVGSAREGVSQTRAPGGLDASENQGIGIEARRSVRLVDQLLRFRLVDRVVVEGGVFEHLDHLAGDLVAPDRDRLDLRFEDPIGGVVVRERGRRNPG